MRVCVGVCVRSRVCVSACVRACVLLCWWLARARALALGCVRALQRTPIRQRATWACEIDDKRLPSRTHDTCWTKNAHVSTHVTYSTCRITCRCGVHRAHMSYNMIHVSYNVHTCRAACTRFVQHAHVSYSVHTCRTACTRVVHHVDVRTGDDECRRRGLAAAGAAGQAGTPQSRVRWRAWPIPPIAGSCWLGLAS
jgi:hypothetical protein